MERMDTLKLVYTQLEAFNLVDEYTEAYKKKIKQLEEENKKLKNKIDLLEFDVDAWYQLKLLLEGEIERLRKENEELMEYKSMYEGLC